MPVIVSVFLKLGLFGGANKSSRLGLNGHKHCGELATAGRRIRERKYLLEENGPETTEGLT